MENIPKNYDQIDQWKSLMFLYSSALKEINVKIEILNNEFIQIYNYNPIEHVKSRLKTPESIVKKLKRMGAEVNVVNMTEKISDIAGIRIICSFTSDIYQIADMISRQRDVTVLYIKDYIKNPKPNGYKSYHMVVTIPVYLTDGPVETKVEIQIRTVAMDFWASLEHKIYYKSDFEAPDYLQRELKACADVVDMLDAKMFSLNQAILEWNRRDDGKQEEKEPEKLTLTYERKQTLRYGENSHQAAAFYQSALLEKYSIAAAKQLHGKELSYNNIRDADAALRIMKEYDEPTVVALKHMNPCGIGTASTILEAWEAAYEADPVSIFGGIIVLNREVDLPTAEQMHKLFLEIIIAPSYTQEALELLQKKKNIRLLTVDFAQEENQNREETVSVLGGLLVQDQDLAMENEEEWKVVTKRKPTPAEAKALAFAWKAVKHVKSNAIVLANERQTVGIGAGQMNRVGSVKIAIEQAQEKMEGAVLASDAYFPMDDSVEYAAKHGIKAIIQPGGSIKDQDSIDMANKYDLAMVFTDVRHFRH